MGLRTVKFLILFLLSTSLSYQSSAVGNETNILRLGKPRSNLPSKNEPEVKKDLGKKPKKFKFTKSNPELDWKIYLWRLAEEEDRTRSNDLDLDFTKDELEKTANSVQWLNDLYDPLRWKKVPGNISTECRMDMDKFLQDLKNGELWAAKCEFRYIYILLFSV